MLVGFQQGLFSVMLVNPLAKSLVHHGRGLVAVNRRQAWVTRPSKAAIDVDDVVSEPLGTFVVSGEMGFDALALEGQLLANPVAPRAGRVWTAFEWLFALIFGFHVELQKSGGGRGGWKDGGECRSLAPRGCRMGLCAELRLTNAAILTSGSHFGFVVHRLPNCQ